MISGVVVVGVVVIAFVEILPSRFSVDGFGDFIVNGAGVVVFAFVLVVLGVVLIFLLSFLGESVAVAFVWSVIGFAVVVPSISGASVGLVVTAVITVVALSLNMYNQLSLGY